MLNKIMHYRIREEVERQLAAARAQGERVVALDAPLLLEVGWQKMTDEVWVVYVGRATQLARLIARNGYTMEEAAVRIAAQMSLEDKRRLADVVIDNSYDVDNTRRQIEEQW